MRDVQDVGEQAVYEIRVQGNLDLKWSDWFGGFAITPTNESETWLIGSVADQAALHGILHKIRDLGLPLLSVRRLDGTQKGEETCDRRR